jgi:hypothetical protein
MARGKRTDPAVAVLVVVLAEMGFEMVRRTPDGGAGVP